MPYVTATYYRDTYGGVDVSTWARDFDKYEARAERMIDLLTRGRIKAAGIDSFPAAVADLIRNAVCAQIEYYAWNGLDTSINGTTNTGSFTVGRVSVSGGSNNGEQDGASSMIAPAARAYLEQTGLLYAGVPVLERRWFYC